MDEMNQMPLFNPPRQLVIQTSGLCDTCLYKSTCDLRVIFYEDYGMLGIYPETCTLWTPHSPGL
jgi:hypothetical protein